MDLYWVANLKAGFKDPNRPGLFPTALLPRSSWRDPTRAWLCQTRAEQYKHKRSNVKAKAKLATAQHKLQT